MSEQPSVRLVTGRSQPGECGVADYAARLVRALSAQGVDIGQVCLDRLRDLPAAVRGLAPQTIVHVQYPLLAWRTSPIPVLMLLWLRLRGHRRLALTIHEFSRAHWARRMVCVVLARLSPMVLSTSQVEASSLRHRLAGRSPIEVVPIASNISVAPPSNAPVRRAGIVYFGLLAPDKGLEQFFEIVAPWMDGATPVTVVGSVVPGHEAWLDALKARHGRARFRQGLSSDEVSAALRRATVAVLPYPDGISERRGSALAALAHGLQVVSTRGRATTPDLGTVCHLVEGVAQARECTGRLLNDAGAHIDAGTIGAYVDSRSWHAIAERHVQLYGAASAPTGEPGWK
jgi:glycosyltransferase involved in cell wall biosynthesis